MLERSGATTTVNARSSPIVPKGLFDATVSGLDRFAAGLVAIGCTANAVTATALVVAAVGGVLLATGRFAPAAVAMVVASLGDAVDGLVARRSRSASASGALLDASADRYEEFFFLGGLAVYFRASVPLLVLALAALAGSFMVSYGSAKAEGLAVAVPGGAMRRAERAMCLCLGVGIAASVAWLAARGACPGWLVRVVLGATLAVIAVAANFSAVRRLRLLGRIKDEDRSVAVPRTERTSSPPRMVPTIQALASGRRIRGRGRTGRGRPPFVH